MSMLRIFGFGAQCMGATSLQRTTSFLSTNRIEFRPNTTTSERERAKSVAAFYNQPAVEAAAKKVWTGRNEV